MSDPKIQEKLANEFIRILKDVIPKVEETYFSRDSWGILRYYVVPKSSLFEKMSNRIEMNYQCELYRLTKNEFEEYILKKGNEQLLNYCQSQLIRLESGISKNILSQELYEKNGLSQLLKEYAPDFLLHNPENIFNQLVIGELKTNPELSFNDFKYDLDKIIEFIQKYNFLKGVFIAVNISQDKILELVGEWKSGYSMPGLMHDHISILHCEKHGNDCVEYKLV